VGGPSDMSDVDFKELRSPSKAVLWIRQNIGFALLVSMFAGSLLLNVKLFQSVRTPMGQARPVAGVAVGIDLHSLPVADVSGNREELKLGDGKPMVLYVMAPTCVWCARNIENIRALEKSAGSQYRFIGVSSTPEGLAEHLAAKPLPFPVYAANRDQLPKGFDPGPTPQLVVVGGDGRVEKVWRGALQASAQSEVESFFHTTLPGLVKPGNL
jgi:hypothetical protein